MKNVWFTNKAKEAEIYHQQKKQGEFYATIRQVHEPKSRTSNQIKPKQGRLLTTPDEMKDRWMEHFSDLNISVETDESIRDGLDDFPVKHDLEQPIMLLNDNAIKNTKLV